VLFKTTSYEVRSSVILLLPLRI